MGEKGREGMIERWRKKARFKKVDRKRERERVRWREKRGRERGDIKRVRKIKRESE